METQERNESKETKKIKDPVFVHSSPCVSFVSLTWSFMEKKETNKTNETNETNEAMETMETNEVMETMETNEQSQRRQKRQTERRQN